MLSGLALLSHKFRRERRFVFAQQHEVARNDGDEPRDKPWAQGINRIWGRLRDPTAVPASEPGRREQPAAPPTMGSANPGSVLRDRLQQR